MLCYITCKTFLASCYAAWSTFRITAQHTPSKTTTTMKLVCNIAKHQQCFFHHFNLLPPFIFCPAMPAMHNTILKPRMPEMHLPINWTDGIGWESQLMQTKGINFHSMQRMHAIIQILPGIQNICWVTSQQKCHLLFSQECLRKKLPPCEEIEKSLEEELCFLSQNSKNVL